MKQQQQQSQTSSKSTAALCFVSILSATSALALFALNSGCNRPIFAMDSLGMQNSMQNSVFMPNHTASSPNTSASQSEPRQRYAILSVGTDAKYSYWLPAVALAWKIRQRFTPVVFLIEDGDNVGWRNHTHTQLILDILAEYDIEHVYFFTADSSLPDNRIRLTQLCRLYASMLPFLNDHDFLLTTDVDLLPVAVGDGQYYDSLDHSQSNQRERILLFDLEEFQANDDKWGYHFKEWALSNIGMTAFRWRQILRLPVPISPTRVSVEKSITERVNEDIRTVLLSTGNEWFWDQQLVSLRLETAQRSGGITWEDDVLVKFRTNRNRIDRIAWPSRLSGPEIDTKFDSHLPRVPDTRGTYREIFDMSQWLLQYVLNGTGEGNLHLARLSKYTTDFQNSLQ